MGIQLKRIYFVMGLNTKLQKATSSNAGH